MSRFSRFFTGALAAGVLAMAGSTAATQAATVPESDGPVVLGYLDWTGQDITMQIAAEILRRMGYTVEFVKTTQFPLFQATVDGEIHAYLEQWLVTSRHQFEEHESKGELERLGLLGIDGVEGWFYPDYVEADCPGLPDWKALQQCEELFASPETFPRGRVVDYPEEWTPDSQKWADALDLEITAISAGGEGAIVAEIKSAVARKEPVLVMYWTPNWAVQEYGMKMVALPEFSEECESDPSWGVNPNATFDCGAPVPPIVKFAWPGLKDKFPAAYHFLKNYQLTNEIQSPLMKRIDVDNLPVEEVARQWVDENQALWEPWTQM